MKLALVTGGHRRLGAAIAARLAAAGWTIALHGAREAEPETLLGDWAGFVADLAEPAQVAALLPQIVARFGAAPTLLVNNASMFGEDDARSADAASLARYHQVNAAAPQVLALDVAKRSLAGSVVNIVDQRVRNPVPDQLSYSLSKAALAAATRTLAVALAPGWRVNAVAPGPTLPTADYSREQWERTRTALPLERLPSPADVAAAVAYLADAPAVTGQTLFVDGGANLRGYERDFAHL